MIIKFFISLIILRDEIRIFFQYIKKLLWVLIIFTKLNIINSIILYNFLITLRLKQSKNSTNKKLNN